MDFLLEPFRYDFLIRAFVAGVVLAVVAPTVGIFLVVRGYALFADTLAHVSLLGVAIAAATGIPTVIGAMGAAPLASFGIERLRSGGRVMNESVLAIFLSGSLALAVVLLSVSGAGTAGLFSYLFGSLSTVSSADLAVLGSPSLVAAAFFVIFFRELFLISVDEELARVSGVRIGFVDLVFIAIAGLIVASSIRIVGVLLVGALMVVPVLAALQFGRGFRATLLLSLLPSLVSLVSGFYASYYLDLPSGGAIVLFAIASFILSAAAGRISWRSRRE